MTSLLLCRIVRPSYQFLVSYFSPELYADVRRTIRPDLFAIIDQQCSQLGTGRQRLNLALTVICKIVLHTGRDVHHITADDVLTFRTWSMRHANSLKSVGGVSLAWVLLRSVADLGDHLTLWEAVRHGQRPTAELVDAHQVKCDAVRQVLVRYLDERRPSLDYNSFSALVDNLAGRFWADIEHHHPGIDSLHLPEDVAEAWKQRTRMVIAPDGSSRPRRGHIGLLICVRGFYRDLQEWALQDPSWAQWSVPSPVRKRDTAGLMKVKKQTTAEMHQRVRERLPHLPTLIDTATRHKTDQAALLAAASRTEVDATFVHADRRYRRTIPDVYLLSYYRGTLLPVQVQDLATGETIDVRRAEHEAFWAWAVIETLRHTGVRIEELLEITHLALVSYRLPDTGEIVPMLQIMPSKSNEERLLPVD